MQRHERHRFFISLNTVQIRYQRDVLEVGREFDITPLSRVRNQLTNVLLAILGLCRTVIEKIKVPDPFDNEFDKLR